MNICRITLIGFLIFLSLSRTEAASFDCQIASSRIEKAICSDTRLNDLDNQLGYLYREVKNSIGNPHYVDQFVGESRKWLKARNRCRNKDCIRQKYHNRITQLQSMLPRNTGNNTSFHNGSPAKQTIQIPAVTWGACMTICEDSSFCKKADHNEQTSVCTLHVDTNHPDYKLLQKRCSKIPSSHWKVSYKNDRWLIECSR
jgi:uncharacterized protein